MSESVRDFNIDYNAAVAAEEVARQRLSKAPNVASRIALGALVIYRRLDTAVLYDLAREPQLKRQPSIKLELEYD